VVGIVWLLLKRRRRNRSANAATEAA
jgi:hypothetical protein